MSVHGIAESHVEEAMMAWLGELGYETAYGPDVEPEKPGAERDEFTEVVLARRLRSALERVNRGVPPSALDDAVRRIMVTDSPSLVENNRRFRRLLVDGVDVEYALPDGGIKGDQVWLVDFDAPGANDWFAVNQFTVVEGKVTKRPDVVVFVNGLPLVVVELKNPTDEKATVKKAFNQLQTYRQVVPSLFTCNELLIASDGMEARHGTLTAPWEQFMPWRTTDGSAIAAKGAPELATLVRGMLDRRRLLDLVRDFVVFAANDAEVRDMPRRNLAVELLEKLLRDEVKAVFRRDLVESRRFSEMPQSAVVQYQNRAITSAQVIGELIALARESREAHRRGEELGLSEDELAFYDALETNDSAVAVLGDEKLKTIARELVETGKRNATIDRNLRESARARMRVMVKRLLRKHDYPPDKQEHATQPVLAQAEVVCEAWAA